VLAADLPPADLEDRRAPARSCVDESLYGLRIGTTFSTPAEPSSPSRCTCSRSPTAPMTVTSSPRERWALRPTPSTRVTTAWISSSVAVGFITIITSLQSFRVLRLGAVLLAGSFDARPRPVSADA
jgi:hypothetical protein